MSEIEPLFLTILLLSGWVCSVAAAPPRPDRIQRYKQIGDIALDLHIFNPPDHKPGDGRPAILFFFGGGWVGGSPAQFYPQSAYLASRGMVAICAEYRIKNEHGATPKECVKDGKSALRWVRLHADELGIDPQRLAAGGGSAGGHVAAAAATAPGFNEEGENHSVSCRPNALVLFNPVYDNGPGGFGHDRVKAYWQTISPLHNISSEMPPAIVFFGTRDRHVPVRTAREFQRKMQAAGVRSELRLYEDQPHGFFNKARFTETLIEADRFLVSLGYLEGEPTLNANGLDEDSPPPKKGSSAESVGR